MQQMMIHGHLLGQEVRDIREDEDQDSMVTWWVFECGGYGKALGMTTSHPPEDFPSWVP